MKIELLAPAGNLKKMKFAFTFGADAVYLGLPDFSLRNRINTITYKDIKEAVEYAHSLNKKVYVTVNIYPHKNHLKKLSKHVLELKKIKPDALIVSDPGVIAYLQENWPEVKLHLSTQANCTNWRATKFWFEQGIKRIILAREATLEDIKQIHKKVPKVELESFVHGAMCMSYSGRCLLSKWFTDRSANLGDCSQPCRWQYQLNGVQDLPCANEFGSLALEEAKRPGSYFPIEQDSHGTYIMNSKDLCLIRHLDKLKKAGISSFKIEGRAKSIYYLGNTLRAYREAMDNPQANLKKLYKELQKSQNRGFTTGFIFGKETVEQRFESSHKECKWEFCGEVVDNKEKEGNMLKILVHNTIRTGDKLELVIPQGEVVPLKVKLILDENFIQITEAHGGQDTFVFIPFKEKLPPMTLLRRKI